MVLPKIMYVPAGLSHQTTLSFTYPPVMKPGADQLVASALIRSLRAVSSKVGSSG
jgi:hypothetical protein